MTWTAGVAATLAGCCLVAAPASAASPRPDLRVTHVSFGAGTVKPGGKVKLGDRTRNFGKGRAPRSSTRYLLSLDATASRADLVLGSRSVRALKRRKQSKGATTGSVPAAARPGVWFVLACADARRKVRESRERNNCRPSAARLGVAAPDGTVPGATGGPGDGGSPGGGGGDGTGGGPAGGGPVVNPSPPVLAGCQVMPTDNEWNRDISADPVDPMSDTYIKYMQNPPGGAWNLRADWGGGSEPFYGIPWVAVPESQPLVPITYGVDGADYSDESDPGPFPFPQDIPIEGGAPSAPDPATGDRHAIALRQGDCTLFETFNTVREPSGFRVSSSARFDLKSNATRPQGWTSGDAAGLPILPGLAKYEEVSTGELTHALRFTVPRVQRAWVAPATHYGTMASQCYPPYGARVRLEAGFDLSGFTGQSLVIAKALKKYGLMLADQGSAGFLSGTSNAGWDTENLKQLRNIQGTDLEVVAHHASITYAYNPSTGACSG